ncbi:hypothetical protein DRF65_16610 [Chryseobacterium pennae]|uniref:Hydroxyacid dehydrogenase n=1 Tax=Chryseobacterium pennae TaxID=2258962 RepID=A0A3D9C6Z1_9FLAO|nr:NAD(P)-dependent oxidoreductase [Chryseobacterium pennae]REC61336.1 hypothetical protein DRF65_16610 [Chryseobacterium pennae]
MKALVIDPLSPSTIERLKTEVNLCYIPNSSLLKVVEQLKDTEVLILRSSHILTKEMVDIAAQLKAVIRAGNGTENIPIEYLQQKNIYFSNIRNVSDNSVAEYAIGLIILGLRNLFPAWKSVNEGRWEKEQLIGNEIKGKTLGLLGFGNIGKKIADLIEPLGVTILYNNVSGEIMGSNHKYANKEELFRKSDIICIQMPLNSNTNKLVDYQLFQLMKSTSILINLSRYEILNMDSLEKFFNDRGKLKGVYIDPFEKKYFDDVQRFVNHPVYFLPHLGANTFEAQDRIGEDISKIIKKIKK